MRSHLLPVALAAAALVLAAASLIGGRPDEPAIVIRQVAAAPAAPAGAAPDWRSIARRAEPALATVRARFGDDPATDAQGSAFAISPGGWLVTNEHVIVERSDGAPPRVADQVWLDYADGRTARARVVGRDPDADLALLRAEGQMPRQTLALAAPGALAAGDPVATFGAPAGLSASLSVGVVSATGRGLPVAGGRYTINGAIQTDAMIAPGSSGGPLLDAAGNVVGVVAQFEGDEGQGRRAGFAIPVATLRRELAALRAGGVVRRGMLGVTGQTIGTADANALGLPGPGVLVQEVSAGSPAAAAGLRAGGRERELHGRMIATGGDLVIAADGAPLRDAADLAERVSAASPGDRMRVDVVRDGERISLSVTLGARPLR